MTWKITPLSKFEILGVFINILVADDKYPNRDCENLKSYYSKAIILKTKKLFSISFPFMESSSSFQHCRKKI